MSPVLRIAREEWRWLRRDRVAVLGLVLLLLLTAVSIFHAAEQRDALAAERARRQSQVDHAFEAAPDRHPHRMVHYGHFVFRPLNPLAAFDPGVDAQTGHTLFLEGHRQNSANFSEARQSSLLLRFGQLTPAFVLQVLAPLLLVFAGHAMLAREREAGTLRVLLAQGVRPAQVVAGKLLALAGLAGLLLLPCWLALGWLALATPAPAALAGALAVGYGLWLALWVLGVCCVSSWLTQARSALVALLAVWVIGVVLLPRLAAEWAAVAQPLPTRVETDIAIVRELAALGNSHNANDPYFSSFRAQVLAQYGAARVQDLPLNYKGLVAMEGERLTSELFERHAETGFALQQAQLQSVDRFAVLAPVLALRRISMGLAGTDLSAYHSFLAQGERHRYQLVQALNRLQAEKLTMATDRSSRDDRIAASHWHDLAAFRFEAVPPSQALRKAAPSAGVLLLWLAALACALVVATRRIGKAAP